jgi:hypothetical protein
MAGKSLHPESVAATPLGSGASGVFQAFIEALALPEPAERMAARARERAAQAWADALDLVRDAEAMVDEIGVRFPAGAGGSPEAKLRDAALALALNSLDERRAALLELPAPDAAGLRLKIATFAAREGDFLSGEMRGVMDSIVRDAGRLLP